MKQRTLLIVGISLILTGLLGVTVLAVIAGIGLVADAPRTASGGSSRSGGASEAGVADAMFIEQMVPHHQDAIDMAKLARTRAQRREIRELAAQIERSQTAENQQMREWYEQWFDEEVPDAGGRGMGRGGMGGGMMGSITDLERLRDAEDFDREFIEQMVPHHRMALMMAGMARRSARNEDLRELADTMIEDQSREIDDMERWYREWYGDE